MWALWVVVLVAGVALIVWGAETFAEHLGRAATRLGVGAFALALLLAGAEPEELATVVTASLRGAPGIAFGDIIGTNIAMCTVALGLGAVIATLPFSPRVFLYAVAALPVGAFGVVLVWDGELSRLEGAILVLLYVVYVAVIWRLERAPPLLGEVEELAEAEEEMAVRPAVASQRRVGIELGLVLAGLAAMVVGSTALVEAVRQITSIEATQTKLGLTLVGFATAFELVMLVWSASRRGATDVALAGVVGSFGYNMTMSLGAGALVKPLALTDATILRAPAVGMIVLLVAVLALALPTRRLGPLAGLGLLATYPVFVLLVVLL
ncbi:MAG: sodium:calcium antiporter [Dehalococcoidia bacterium]|nr:sodium:calcium antiporter [Dehalococcoidia bacterium]